MRRIKMERYIFFFELDLYIILEKFRLIKWIKNINNEKYFNINN